MKEWLEPYDMLQRILLALLAGMILVFGVTTFVLRTQKGVEFGGELLRREITEEAAIYTGKELTVTVRKNGAVTVVEHTSGGKTDVYTVEYPLAPIQTEHVRSVDGIRIMKNETPFFEGGYAPNADFTMWYTADGEWDSVVSVTAVTSGGQTIGAAPESFSRGNVMYFAREPELTSRGSLELYLACVLLSLLVMVNTAHPEWLFRWRHALSVRDPEPTDFYMAAQSIGNCASAALLFGMYVYGAQLIL